MHTTRLRQIVATLTAAAVLATMTVATVAAPASAAKPKCQGKTATIVGTRKGERIVGTARRDVIVAKGGNDRIYGRGGHDLICAGTGHDLVVGGPGADTLWGQLGNDRLHGGPGNDFLAGQVGNDTLNGGLNFDKCFGGTGGGLVVNCELPATALPAPPPAPPEPPTLLVAFTDLNDTDVFDAGDMMISKMVDTDGNGVPSEGDTILMGRYPTSTNPGPADFADWSVKSHIVDGILQADLTEVRVTSTIGGDHWWWSESPDPDKFDEYNERFLEGNLDESDFVDKVGAAVGDRINVQSGSPSRPVLEVPGVKTLGPADDRFIDVEFFFKPAP